MTNRCTLGVLLLVAFACASDQPVPVTPSTHKDSADRGHARDAREAEESVPLDSTAKAHGETLDSKHGAGGVAFVEGPAGFCLVMPGEICSPTAERCEEMRIGLQKELDSTIPKCKPVFALWCSKAKKHRCMSSKRECQTGALANRDDCEKVRETPLVLSAQQRGVVDDWVAFWDRMAVLADKHKDNCDAAAAAMWKEIDQNRAVFKALHELNVAVGEKRLRVKFASRIEKSMDRYFFVTGETCAKNDAMDRVRMTPGRLYNGK
jgi:hypothetical protein